MKIKINPVPKPRMTQRDKWAKRPAVMRYRAYCDELRYKMKKEIGNNIDIEFHVAMPESWTKKKKARKNGQPHMRRPDLDNYIKGFLDALLEEDSEVWKIKAIKVNSYEGMICVK